MIEVVPMSADNLAEYLNFRYPQKRTLPGFWRCEVDQFKFSDELRTSELVSVFKGQTPDGKVSVLHESTFETYPAGWMVTASSPAAIGLLWGLAPRAPRSLIESAHLQSTENCLMLMERFLMDGKSPRQNQEGLPRAFVARERFFNSEPQLKTEVFVPNLLLTLEGPSRRFDKAWAMIEQVPLWSACHDDLICGHLKNSLGLEFHREGAHGPEIIGLSSSLLRNEPSKLAWSAPSQKEQARQFESRCELRGWGKTNAGVLLKHSQERRTEFKRLQEWKERRIEETRKRKTREETEKPGIRNLWKKTTLRLSL